MGKQILRYTETVDGISDGLRTRGMTVVGWGGLVQDIPVPADYDWGWEDRRCRLS